MSKTIDFNNYVSNVNNEQNFFSNKATPVDNQINVSIFSQYDTCQDNILKADDQLASTYLDNNINIENILNNTLSKLPEEQRTRFEEYLQTQNLNSSDFKSSAIGSLHEKYTQRIANTEDEVTALQKSAEQECTTILSNKAQFFTARYETFIRDCSTQFSAQETNNANDPESVDIDPNLLALTNEEKLKLPIGFDTKYKGVSASKDISDNVKLKLALGLKGGQVSVAMNI